MAVKILFGSETGNAEGLANDAQNILKKNNIEAEVVDMADVKLNDLKEYKKALFITSTWGDGDAPDNASSLLEELKDSSDKCLGNLEYAVFGIGEDVYEHFCKAAIDFDEALANLGAKRIFEVKKCGEDYEDGLSDWVNEVMAKIK